MRIFTIVGNGDDMTDFVVGVKQTSKALINQAVQKCYVANDADPRVVNGIIELCKEKNIQLVYVDTMKELGSKFNLSVGAASAAELK